MNKFKSGIALALAVCVFSSCATVFGGKVNAYQRTKPVPGQEQRPVRVGALIADILLFWPGTIVDFATGAIYKPHPKGEEAKSAENQVPVTTATK